MNVPNGNWYIGRLSPKGAGPKCCGSPGKSSARDECRNFVKRVSFPDPRGRVAVAIFTSHNLFGGQVSWTTWFCPNNVCLRGKPRHSIIELPLVPNFLPILIGTFLSEGEIEFLSKNQLILQEAVTSVTPGLLAPILDLRINVNTFREQVKTDKQEPRFTTQNGRLVQNRGVLSSEHVKRIRSSKEDCMRLISENIVEDGNGWGKQILVGTHETDGKLPKQYWIQICCFRACSCDDFFNRHMRNWAYVPCKHLYWVFRSQYNLSVRADVEISQPVLSLKRVRNILSI